MRQYKHGRPGCSHSRQLRPLNRSDNSVDLRLRVRSRPSEMTPALQRLPAEHDRVACI